MKFSLKTMLVVVCALGATIGVMWKLFTEQPETFLQVVNLGSTVGPFLLSVGTIVWIGLSGTQFRPAVLCAQCQHDLSGVDLKLTTSCPGCGADLGPSNRKAVLHKRRWGLVGWGLCLLLTPIVVQIAIAWMLPTGNPLQLLGTHRLIHNRLPNQVNEPWAWNELVNRLNRRALSAPEVDEALRELTSYMKKTHPGGWNEPLPWQKDFIQAALQARMLSDEVFFDLCDAFYGPQPIVQPLPPVAQGNTGFQLDVKYGSPWSTDSGLGVELLWDVKQVLMDGIPMKVRQTNMSAQNWSGYCEGELKKSGDHEVTVEIECAYIDQNKLFAPNASNLPSSQWPQARKRWTTTISVPLKVRNE